QRLSISSRADRAGERERVAGVRVFDSQARLSGYLPFEWSDQPPTPDQWARLKQGESIGQLHARESAEEIVDLPRSPAPAPAFDVWVPLRQGDGTNLLGAAQFVMS